MGFFSKLWKGPEVDLEKSGENAKKMRQMFDRVVENGGEYRLISGYTEDVSRFNYGFVHGSKTKIGNLIVGWNEPRQTIVVVPTVPDLSGCGAPTYYRRSEILKAYRNKYPTDAFIIYPDKKGYIGINAYDWLEDEKLYVYVAQEEELAAFTEKNRVRRLWLCGVLTVSGTLLQPCHSMKNQVIQPGSSFCRFNAKQLYLP